MIDLCFLNVNMSFVFNLVPRALFPGFEKRPEDEVALFALPYTQSCGN